ncbi:MAG: helix-turn-helix domain-containing protein [Deltaproteobacteria bacterium]|nr:helix-turn-helix domain-containing protein [Deltaproteobacteria bacterium]MBT4266320.1 helix-turn-helix domain-containing protein [Deltaproteobacteria bacterium]MBT4642164.1 helix-turn-helix domain-containing protein [Deltaproteobacteria bacterium]MBT6501530.1 helix-turn-helix domain-containing protein [Deltaproteobacteria bacterium]MBT6616523.1 helix-turn-helix domain-containing protein [Deltaproteobacteria bacterium]
MAAINKIIHEPARLRILTFLVTSNKEAVSFNELQKKLEFSSGNLSLQLKKLSSSDYIKIHKTFKDNKPFTTVSLTPMGSEALNQYVDEMKKLISSLKKS